MAESIGDLERWNGGFPGDHEFSDLEGLVPSESNPELAVFFEAAKKLTEDWQGNKFAGLYLYGTPGTGKTHAAIGLGRALHDAGSEVFYRYCPILADDIKRKVNQGLDYWTRPRASSPVGAYMNSAFPASDGQNVTNKRNPKVALILDDYRPEAQIPLHLAVDAAAQYGGLVIVTSNYTDPFKLVEINDTPDSERAIELDALLENIAPEVASQLQDHRTQIARGISDSLRSRIASAFKFIEFGGEDRRPQNSFWA